MTLQLLSTFDPWRSYRSQRRALRVGRGCGEQITFEFTKNMPLCSRADIITFLPEACWNSRLLAPYTYSQHVSLVPPACSLSFFGPSWPESGWTLVLSSLWSIPPLSSSCLFISCSKIFCILLTGTVVKPFFCVFHGQKKNTWDSKSTNDFSFKQAGKLDLRRVSYMQ